MALTSPQLSSTILFCLAAAWQGFFHLQLRPLSNKRTGVLAKHILFFLLQQSSTSCLSLMTSFLQDPSSCTASTGISRMCSSPGKRAFSCSQCQPCIAHLPMYLHNVHRARTAACPATSSPPFPAAHDLKQCMSPQRPQTLSSYPRSAPQGDDADPGRVPHRTGEI